MQHRYAVLGTARQGTAAAYDLARHGTADFFCESPDITRVFAR